MSIWYRTIWHDSSSVEQWAGPKVEEVEILKTTSASVWVGDRRHAMRSSYENFFETRAEAEAFISDSQRLKMEYHRNLAAKHEANMKRFAQPSR